MSCRSTPGSSAIVSAARTVTSLDDAQIQSVYHAYRRKIDREIPKRATGPNTEEWAEFLTQERFRIHYDEDLPSARKRSIMARLDAELTNPTLPDARTFAALHGLRNRADYADRRWRQQIDATAAWRACSQAEAKERITEYRDEWRSMTLAQRRAHTPPDGWAAGVRRDSTAWTSPADPATLYALHRAETTTDPFTTQPAFRGYAVIDLETNGFNPRQDDIIEVGVVVLDLDFNEIDRYETLVKPPPRPAVPGESLTREERLDTGAVHIHGISVDDVRDARDFDEIAFELTARLSGRCLVAHNAPFELGHLRDSFRKAGMTTSWSGVLDTLRIARRHMPDLPNARLATVCEDLGVNYTNGHRALHDAEVTVGALRQMNRRLHPHPVVPAA